MKRYIVYDEWINIEETEIEELKKSKSGDSEDIKNYINFKDDSGNYNFLNKMDTSN